MFDMFRTGKYLSDGMQSRVRVFANLKMEIMVFIIEKECIIHYRAYDLR